MSYQVLARKWRPKRFSEMVGQQHVLKALENALNQNRLHHAYLFTGTRGVGKTTIARIFAKCLNCEQGVSAEPCGSCSICKAVDEGRFLDLMEIDAASHTGVDSIRELLDNTQYSPTQGTYKVYLIDEVHMLSSSAFNALLKTLEEPPEHVKFILATTDPQKLPVTILSRCLQFNLKAMSAKQIADHLKNLLEKEMISYEDDALNLIAKAADGSMRDALSITDQAIAHGNEKLKTEEVRSMLGMVDRVYVSQLLEALASKDAKTLLDCVEKISSDSPSYKTVLAELISFIHRLVIEQATDIEKDENLKRLAALFTAEELQLYYQFALKGRQDLAITPDQREGFEMCLLRMMLFSPEKIIAPSSGGSGKGNDVGKNQIENIKANLQKKKAELGTKTEGNQDQQKNTPAQDNKSGAKAEKPSTNNQTINTTTSVSTERFSYESIPDKWTQIFLKLPLSGPAQIIAKNSNLEKIEGRHFKLVFDKKFEMLATEQARNNIHKAVNDYFGSTLQLDFLLEAPTSATPEQLFSAMNLEKARYAEQSILEDDRVKELMNEFGAHIQDGSAQLLN